MNDITIFAMTKKGYEVVKAIFDVHPDIISTVVAARDSNIENDYFLEILNFCREKKIIFFEKSENYTINTKYTIAISWRWIINNKNTKLIVFHDSLLPKYRGFNPLVTALINGDSIVGVTALYASNDYDCGDVIFQSSSNISYPIKIKDAIDIVVSNYIIIAKKISLAISQNFDLESFPQNSRDSSYSLWRDEEDYFIDWSKSAIYIKRMIDATGSPYMGAASYINNILVRIIDAEVFPDVFIVNRGYGKIIFIDDNKPVVVCGNGLLKINELIDAKGNNLIPLSRFRVRFKNVIDDKLI